jgi:hypothetical protein
VLVWDGVMLEIVNAEEGKEERVLEVSLGSNTVSVGGLGRHRSSTPSRISFRLGLLRFV